MPINEARGYRLRSTLSAVQQAEALRAIYGVAAPDNHMSNPHLSVEDIERMRLLVRQHDQENRVGIQEIDLNNPPKVPYFYQEFPRIVYHHAKRKHRTAQNAAELAAALEAGWTKEPFPSENVEDDDTDDATAAEIAALDAKAKQKKK